MSWLEIQPYRVERDAFGKCYTLKCEEGQADYYAIVGVTKVDGKEERKPILWTEHLAVAQIVVSLGDWGGLEAWKDDQPAA